VLPDSAANTDIAPFFAVRVAFLHSVVTAYLIDETGQATITARNEILSFLRSAPFRMPPRVACDEKVVLR
jgi:hypothetical protein